MVVAIAISVLLAVVTLAPWLSRYLPWRLERLRRLRAAHRVIRSAPDISEREVQRLLAMRALTTLEYGTLLEYSPDPFGDFASGRHDRLAKAELAQVGLKL
jgi:multidrug efflux pump subunit AcrB